MQLDFACGDRRAVAVDDLQQLLGGDAVLRKAQILLKILDRLQHAGGVLAVKLAAVVAQVAQAVLQIQHLRPGGAGAQIVFGDAQEFGVAHAGGSVVGGHPQQLAQVLVALGGVVNRDLRAHEAVLGDELRVLHPQPDAAVGGGQAELAGGLRLHAVHVLRIEGQGVEHVTQMDARGVLHVALVLRQVRPLGALGGAALRGQAIGSDGRAAVHAGGAEHLPDDAAVLGGVHRDDLVGDVHLDGVRHVLRRISGQGQQAQQETQQRRKDSSYLHNDNLIIHSWFDYSIAPAFLTSRLSSADKNVTFGAQTRRALRKSAAYEAH